MRASSDHIEDHQRDADGDRRVGDVERPEVPAAPVDVDEVDDRADRTIRSMRLPAAPPMMSATPSRGSRLVPGQRAGIERDADERAERDDAR